MTDFSDILKDIMALSRQINQIEKPKDICVCQPFIPMRQHKKKRWMREGYHRRIQKKWIKRFGFDVTKGIETESCVFITYEMKDKINSLYPKNQSTIK